MNNLITRSVTGFFFGLIMLGAALLGQTAVALLYFGITVLALREFYTLMGKSGPGPHAYQGIVAGGLLYVLIALDALKLVSGNYILLVIPVLFILFIAALWRKSPTPFQDLSVTLLGILYIALPLGLVLYLFNPYIASGPEHYGTYAGFLVILWINDTFAYFTGSLVGKHKLFERISPGKTWEGSAGGALFSLLAAWLLSLWMPVMPPWQWLVMAAVIVVSGTLGDLVESMLKRSLGVKDSGNLLPGHGGILDRFDAVLLSVPFVFVFLVLFCR